jgi:hypothetical protein
MVQGRICSELSQGIISKHDTSLSSQQHLDKKRRRDNPSAFFIQKPITESVDLLL